MLLSCNLQNKIVLEGVGKGHMSLSMELPPYMLSSIDTIAASIPGGADLLEPQNITKSLLSSEYIRQPVVRSPKKGAYDIRFDFVNLAGSPKDFLAWKQESNGTTQLSIAVNRQTYQQLEVRFPTLRDNALLQLYGPSTTQDMSSEDYLDMIEYSFGSKARNDLLDAVAIISVQVPGQILAQTGGAKKGKNIVEFRLRLLDFALLKREWRYSVVYR